MQGTLLYAVPDELLGEPATQGQGRRHFVKAKRWEVVGCAEGFLKNTQLAERDAKQMLLDGEFYPDGTTIKIYPTELIVRVKGHKIYDVESGIEVTP